MDRILKKHITQNTEWPDGHGPACQFVQNLRKHGFAEGYIWIFLKLLDETCLQCFDGDKRCQCSNDE